MGSVDRVEDRAFRGTLTEDGAAKLRERVKDKLKEFMGDYTDDTLVEYVVVLLRNGRHKEEARNELNVFLGDNTDSFVSWLWDHLASNLNLYIHPQEAYTDEVLKTKTDQSGTDESHHVELESEKGKFDNLTRSRRKREWKGLSRAGTELPPLLSSDVDNTSFKNKTHQKLSRTRRSPSPRHQQQKKRSRNEGQQHKKREVVSQATIDAPRRLLQFAVRDAVGTLRPSSSVKEHPVQRLCSVVSTPNGDSSLIDRPRRIQSVARVLNPMATVVKAVREAAEDVKKVKSAGIVFDRLGHDMNIQVATDQVAEFRDYAIEDEEDEDFNQLQGQIRSNYLQKSDYGGHMRMMESETDLASDMACDNEDYDDISVMDCRVMDVSQTGASSGMKCENSLMVPYKVARSADDSMRITRNMDQDQSFSTAKTPHKTVNISVDAISWKPPHHQESRDFEEMEIRNSILENEADARKFGVQLMKENSNAATVGNGHAKLADIIQKESLKPLPSAPGSQNAGRPLEDADSQTIFVSNVHFAATKDSLSRHFNKFGEVLKVVIITDATTGQPKGSAYVEFMRKEAADNALSLDGTSFMSRILKVVKRSSAHQEPTPMMAWPRIIRGSTHATPRFARVPFPRGVPGSFRPHLSVKPGARSFQWKRNTQATENGASTSDNTVVTSAGRSLTYVRTKPKPDGNLGTT